MTLPSTLAELRKAPGMYLPTATYEGVVAFLLGYDAAMTGGLLWGFREWLIAKLGQGNNLSWPVLALEIVVGHPSDSGNVLQSPDDHRAAIDNLFATLEEFLVERNRLGGARQIYATYERWLRQQDWYGPSSPDWFPV